MIGFLACVVAIVGLQWSVPFWGWVMLVPLAHAAVTSRRGLRHAVLPGVLAATAVWFAAAGVAWWRGGDITATRVATMLRIGSPAMLLAITALVAFLAATVGAVTGYLVGRPANRGAAR